MQENNETVVIGVRFTKPQRQRLIEYARANNNSISEIIRSVVIDSVGASDLPTVVHSNHWRNQQVAT
jgi:hypothetical protein